MPEAKTIEAQLAYLESLIEKRIKKFENKTEKMKWWTYGLKFSGFFLAAAITVLAGLSDTVIVAINLTTNLTSDIILVLGAASSLLASVAAFWRVERYWLANLVITDKLKIWRDRVKYIKRRQEPLKQEELDELWDRLEGILKRKSQYWVDVLESAPN